MLKHWKKDGPDIVSHVHPHDLYDGFEEQWNRDLEAGYPAICQADTLEELAEKAGIDVEGLLANVDEYNEMCDNGWDDIFEKEREFMKPLEKGPFYCCKQYCGAYGHLGWRAHQPQDGGHDRRLRGHPWPVLRWHRCLHHLWRLL